MQQSVLKVTSVGELKKASTGNGHYQTITVQEFKLIPVGSTTLEVATVKQATRNLWSERDKKDGGKMKGDTFFQQVHPGSYVAGSIETFNTTPYEIDGRVVTSRKVLIFEGENGVNVANSELSSNFACVVDDNGVPTKELNKESLVPQP
jgi:hypothetical protein